MSFRIQDHLPIHDAGETIQKPEIQEAVRPDRHTQATPPHDLPIDLIFERVQQQEGQADPQVEYPAILLITSIDEPAEQHDVDYVA